MKPDHFDANRLERLRNSVVFFLLVGLIALRVMWGYWDRDLTFGDTSSYFLDAVRWHLNGEINIVWSPLYTAYFGSWLNISDNAIVATFLHRLGLVLLTTGLVAWLAYLTLPRVLALMLVVWWIALPIHYDTLYEVHLFGAMPVLAMAVVAFVATDRWRWPLLLGVALVSTFLLRNEYVLTIALLSMLAFFDVMRQRKLFRRTDIIKIIVRYAVVLTVSGLLIAFFYSVSYVKGKAIAEASAPKHTLNMCQVYAFGYQQRHADWSGSPWTECSSLMEAKFGTPMPTLKSMIISNPKEVLEHFLWNLSLTRAGAEVLLFNATGAADNPDYASVLKVPLIPGLLLGLTLSIVAYGSVVVFRQSPAQYANVRLKILRMAPLLLAAIFMGLAVIVTQRPRPSYFLGFGVLYMWVVLVFVSAFLMRVKVLDNFYIATFLALLVFFIPGYRSLSLPSQAGALGTMYSEYRPQAARICQGNGLIAINVYTSELYNYLCGPYSFGNDRVRSSPISVESLPAGSLDTPENLSTALDRADVRSLLIDQFLVQKFPGLGSCVALQSVLLASGWKQLVYSHQDNNGCIAAYIK